jgi:hypothetical protein
MFLAKVSVHRQLGVILICISTLSAIGQTPSSKYQPGTVTAVTAHQNAPGQAATDVARYDVSVKIGNVLYVVLYTPLHGANSVEYSAGIEMLFSVGTDTLTFNSKLSGTTELPILRREVLPAQKVIDWSKAPGQYLSMKQEHLSEALGLTEDQQAKIKPILDQEAGEAGMVLWTPVVSPKDRFKQYEKIVRASDAKIKPFLTSTQAGKLHQLRKQQIPELKRLIAQRSAGKQDEHSN